MSSDLLGENRKQNGDDECNALVLDSVCACGVGGPLLHVLADLRLARRFHFVSLFVSFRDFGSVARHRRFS